MTNFINTGVTPTDPSNLLPLLSRDPMITYGTRYCYDVGDTFSYPGTSPMPVNGGLANLAERFPGLAQLNGVPLVVDTGVEFTTATPSAGLRIADAIARLVSTGGFTLSTWFKWGTNSNSAPLFGFTGPTTPSQVFSLDATRVRIQVVSTTYDTPTNTFVAGTIYQFVIAVRILGPNSWTLSSYVNGVLLNLQTFTTAAPVLQPAAGSMFASAFGFGGYGGNSNGLAATFYRSILDEPTLSGVEPADFALADYTANVGRFT